MTNFRSGVALALLTVALFAIWDVAVRYGVTTLKGDPALFTFLTLLGAAITLLAYAGPGSGGRATLLTAGAWTFGLLQVLSGLFEGYAYRFLTATEANLLIRLSVPLSFVLAFVFLGRRPGRGDLAGAAVVSAGLAYLCVHLPEGNVLAAIGFVTMAAVVFVLRTLVVERHGASRGAPDARTQCRVTGYVLLATCLVSVGFYGLVGVTLDHIASPGGAGPLTPPSLDAFSNGPALLLALGTGISVGALSKYAYFQSTKIIATETYVAIAAFVPAVTFAVELIWSRFLPLDVSSITHHDAIAACLIIGGSLIIARARGRAGAV